MLSFAKILIYVFSRCDESCTGYHALMLPVNEGGTPWNDLFGTHRMIFEYLLFMCLTIRLRIQKHPDGVTA